jgi:hypothetical protein
MGKRQAAAASGIAYSTFKEWMKEGPFSALIKEAEQTFERIALERIDKASKKTWTAAAWRLERKLPERWGKKERVEATVRLVEPSDDAMDARAVEWLKARGWVLTPPAVLVMGDVTSETQTPRE